MGKVNVRVVVVVFVIIVLVVEMGEGWYLFQKLCSSTETVVGSSSSNSFFCFYLRFAFFRGCVLLFFRSLFSLCSILDLVLLRLDEVGDVHGHLVHASVVKLLDVVKRPLVVVRHEVDGHALATETATTTDPIKNDI